MDPNQIEALKDFLPDSTLEMLFNPLAKDIGFTIAGLFYFVFKPLVKRGIKSQSEVDALVKESAQKFNKIEQDKLTTVNKGIAYKAIEDARFSISSQELRKMFANLIANSFNDDNTNNLSPYFSTVISNLTVNDALLLEKFKKADYIYPYIALAKINFFNSKTRDEFSTYKQDLILNKNINSNKASIKSYSKEIDTLQSLGIVNRMYNQIHSDEKDDLDSIKQIIAHQHLKEKLKGHFTLDLNSKKPQEIFINKQHYDTFDVISGSLELTDLGKSFTHIVLL